MHILVASIFIFAFLLMFFSIIGAILLPIAGIGLIIGAIAIIISIIFHVFKLVFSLPMLLVMVILFIIYKKQKKRY